MAAPGFVHHYAEEAVDYLSGSIALPAFLPVCSNPSNNHAAALPVLSESTVCASSRVKQMMPLLHFGCDGLLLLV
jgi:hypothetical protein